jgi:hypothetical protein
MCGMKSACSAILVRITRSHPSQALPAQLQQPPPLVIQEATSKDLQVSIPLCAKMYNLSRSLPAAHTGSAGP